mmetsp:Transcript_8895/g.18834  ORF Transcript_8895/g.18834 Transcript_8895/m.18834 type:complete len:283 (-) Transcript_8895:145-993(-)
MSGSKPRQQGLDLAVPLPEMALAHHRVDQRVGVVRSPLHGRRLLERRPRLVHAPARHVRARRRVHQGQAGPVLLRQGREGVDGVGRAAPSRRDVDVRPGELGQDGVLVALPHEGELLPCEVDAVDPEVDLDREAQVLHGGSVVDALERLADHPVAEEDVRGGELQGRGGGVLRIGEHGLEGLDGRGAGGLVVGGGFVGGAEADGLRPRTRQRGGVPDDLVDLALGEEGPQDELLPLRLELGRHGTPGDRLGLVEAEVVVAQPELGPARVKLIGIHLGGDAAG